MTVDKFYIDILRKKCGIPSNAMDAGEEFQAFYDDNFMDYLIQDASYRHNQKPFRDNMGHLPAIFLLARIEVFTILAGAFAKNYDIGSKDGKLSKKQPHENYRRLVKDLTQAYNKLTSNGSVVFTPVLLSNKSRNLVKNYQNAPHPVIDIRLVEVLDNKVTLNVIPMGSIGVTRLSFYVSPNPIYDMFEPSSLNPTSTLVETVPFSSSTYQVPKDKTSNYLGIVARNKYGKEYFLEVFVGNTATPTSTQGAV